MCVCVCLCVRVCVCACVRTCACVRACYLRVLTACGSGLLCRSLAVASVGLSAMTGNISKDSQPTPVNDTADTCQGLTDLVANQLKLCRSHPHAMPRVALGARLGMMECRHQFHGERWNCSTSGNDTVFSRTYLEQGEWNDFDDSLGRYRKSGSRLSHITCQFLM